MAEEQGFSWGDAAKTGLAGLFGGLPGLAFSPATSGLWEDLSGKVGLSGDQGRSIAQLLFGLASGAGVMGLLPGAWKLAKEFSTPTKPRIWNTPARGPNDLFEYGRSDPAAFTGAPAGFDYLGTEWSPGSAMFFAPQMRHDVTVGPGSAQGMNALMSQGRSFGALGRVGDLPNRIMMKLGEAGPEALARLQGGPVFSDPFMMARQNLGMGMGPDFSRARQLLGMG